MDRNQSVLRATPKLCCPSCGSVVLGLRAWGLRVWNWSSFQKTIHFLDPPPFFGVLQVKINPMPTNPSHRVYLSSQEKSSNLLKRYGEKYHNIFRTHTHTDMHIIFYNACIHMYYAFFLNLFVYIHLFIYSFRSISLLVYPFANLYVWLFVHLWFFLFICMFVFLSICKLVYLFIYTF